METRMNTTEPVREKDAVDRGGGKAYDINEDKKGGEQVCVFVCVLVLDFALLSVVNDIIIADWKVEDLWRSQCWEADMISRNFKNVLVVSVGFLFLFTAYGGLQSLQVGEDFIIYYDLVNGWSGRRLKSRAL